MKLVRLTTLVLLGWVLAMPLRAEVNWDDPHWDANEPEGMTLDDRPVEDEVRYPSWFRLSFLDLPDDLQEALKFRKRGLIVYFGQKFCPYCKALMEKDFGKRDIAKYTRNYFDVVAVNIHGSRTVTTMDGKEMSEKDFAERENTNFTPTLVFYDPHGKEVFRLRGYYPPYKFRAALEYVADRHYLKETFRHYLARADDNLTFEPGALTHEDFFAQPPYALDRQAVAAQRPLAVFFEQGDCHACDVLHGGPLQEPSVRRDLAEYDVVQLDMWGDTPVLTPDGQHLTARQWADELGLFYAPTLIFFDTHGKEIIRVDSVVRLMRLRRVLEYVDSGAYRDGLTLQRWQRQRSKQGNN